MIPTAMFEIASTRNILSPSGFAHINNLILNMAVIGIKTKNQVLYWTEQDYTPRAHCRHNLKSKNLNPITIFSVIGEDTLIIWAANLTKSHFKELNVCIVHDQLVAISRSIDKSCILKTLVHNCLDLCQDVVNSKRSTTDLCNTTVLIKLLLDTINDLQELLGRTTIGGISASRKSLGTPLQLPRGTW